MHRAAPIASLALAAACGGETGVDLVVFGEDGALERTIELGASDRVCLTSGRVVAVTNDVEALDVRFRDAGGAELAATTARVDPPEDEPSLRLERDNPRFTYFGALRRPRHAGRYSTIPSGAVELLARGADSGRVSSVSLADVGCEDPWPRIHWTGAAADDPDNYAAGDFTWTLVQESDGEETTTSLRRKAVEETSDGRAFLVIDWITRVHGLPLSLSARAWVDLASHRVVPEAGDDPDTIAAVQLFFDQVAFDRAALDPALFDDPALIIEPMKPIHMTITHPGADAPSRYEVLGRVFQYDYVEPATGSAQRLRVIADAEHRLAFGARLGFSRAPIDACEGPCGARYPFTRPAEGEGVLEAILSFSEPAPVE